MHRLPTIETVLVLSIGLAGCQQTSPRIDTFPIIDDTSFRNCVDREAKPAVARAIEKKGGDTIFGYPTVIENDIISICNPQMRPETVQDNVFSKNNNYLYLNATIESHLKAATNEKIHNDMLEERKKRH